MDVGQEMACCVGEINMLTLCIPNKEFEKRKYRMPTWSPFAIRCFVGGNKYADPFHPTQRISRAESISMPTCRTLTVCQRREGWGACDQPGFPRRHCREIYLKVTARRRYTPVHKSEKQGILPRSERNHLQNRTIQ